MGAMPASRYAFGSVPWYSVLIVSAIVIGLSLCGHEQKRLKLPADLAIDLALCLIPSAIVGARLYDVAFSWTCSPPTRCGFCASGKVDSPSTAASLAERLRCCFSVPCGTCRCFS